MAQLTCHFLAADVLSISIVVLTETKAPQLKLGQVATQPPQAATYSPPQARKLATLS